MLVSLAWVMIYDLPSRKGMNVRPPELVQYIADKKGCGKCDARKLDVRFTKVTSWVVLDTLGRTF